MIFSAICLAILVPFFNYRRKCEAEAGNRGYALFFAVVTWVCVVAVISTILVHWN